ncbi:MAG: FAD-dependent oxidoreductase [Acidobacteriota bacterium]|nr:FAD-dependent oxidoreductase [Acidobacteriota bacterium]
MLHHTPHHTPARIVIVGGGLAGLSAAREARRLGFDVLLLESNHEIGGLLRTEEVETEYGTYTLDVSGGHWIHTLARPAVRDLLEGLAPGIWQLCARKSACLIGGQVVPYPVQVNLHGVEPALVADYLRTLVRNELLGETLAPPENFREWLLCHFGRRLCEKFMFPYNERVWRYPLEQMSCETQRVPVVELIDVVRGIMQGDGAAVGYNPEFVYPSSGGIATLVRLLATGLESSIRTGEAVVEIRPTTRRAVTARGEEYDYDAMVWTGPLTKLVECLLAAPAGEVGRSRREQLRGFGGRLRHAGLQVALLGQPRRDNRFGDELQWLYVPEGYPFHRVGWSSRVAPYLAPSGCETLYVELSSSRQAQVAEDEVLAALAALGVRAPDQPAHVYRSYWHEYAYPVETLDTRGAVDSIGRVFTDEGWRIATSGRFGAWYYDSICECIEHATQTVARLARGFQGVGVTQ